MVTHLSWNIRGPRMNRLVRFASASATYSCERTYRQKGSGGGLQLGGAYIHWTQPNIWYETMHPNRGGESRSAGQW